MVGRHEDIARVVVVDLDGTLLRANSFRIYVRCGLRVLARRRKAVSFLRVLYCALRRKSGLISHNRYREICARHIGFGPEVLRVVAAEAACVRSKAVARFLEARRAEGYGVLLATAALEAYAGVLWDGPMVASSMKHGIVVDDCRGVRKLELVLEALGGRTPAYMLSDHRADLPLLCHVAQHGGKAVLVNPSTAELRFFRELEPSELFNVELLLDDSEPR